MRRLTCQITFTENGNVLILVTFVLAYNIIVFTVCFCSTNLTSWLSRSLEYAVAHAVLMFSSLTFTSRHFSVKIRWMKQTQIGGNWL